MARQPKNSEVSYKEVKERFEPRTMLEVISEGGRIIITKGANTTCSVEPVKPKFWEGWKIWEGWGK